MMISRGVRREYQNPLYDHAKNRPLSPPPSSLLPIEHPDYSPDMGCKPTVLFPNARKVKRPAAAKGESEGGAGAPTALRRSPRRKSMIRSSDDEGGPKPRAEEEDEDDEEDIIRPRKLDFGLPKNVAGKAKPRAKSVVKAKPEAVVGNNDVL